MCLETILTISITLFCGLLTGCIALLVWNNIEGVKKKSRETAREEANKILVQLLPFIPDEKIIKNLVVPIIGAEKNKENTIVQRIYKEFDMNNYYFTEESKAILLYFLRFISKSKGIDINVLMEKISNSGVG